MKKVLSTLMAVGFIAIVACGPSAEEKAAAEKATQDSIEAANQAENAMMEANAMQDSANMMMDSASTMMSDSAQ